MASPLMSTDTLNKIRRQSTTVNPRMSVALWTLNSIRFQISLLISVATIVFGLMRSCFGMAMVDIVQSNSSAENSLKMNWSSKEQAQIHTSFYIGAFVSVFPSEYMSKMMGPKNLITLALLLNAVGSILTPFIAIYFRHYFPIVFIRFIMGIGYGFLIPGGSVLISKWFPVAEKSTAMAIFTTGNQLGISASMFLTAKISQIKYFDGWPIAFISYGLFSFIFLFIWNIRVSDKPRESKYITATELSYIRGGKQRRPRADTIIRPTPYKRIILNGCVCAICACSFAQSFVLVALVTYLPKYNQIAMKMSLTNNGLWSSLPFIIQMITKIGFAVTADKIKQARVDVTFVTKTANSIASFLSAFFIVIAATLPLKWPQTIQICITISMALFSAYVPGYNTSVVTVAPQFTAFISSYAQLYAHVASTLAPILIGWITNHDTIEEWKIAFCSLAGVLIITGIIFIIFGHGRTEPWGETPSNATSIRNSTCTIAADDNTVRMIMIEKHNNNLRSETSVGSDTSSRKKKISRVSYAGEEILIPARMEDLENDVIYCIEEEEHENKI